MAIEDEIKQGIEKKQVVLGRNAVLRQLRMGKLSKVVLASNPPESLKRDAKHLCGLAGIECLESQISNKDMGAICRKSYSVSVIGFKA